MLWTIWVEPNKLIDEEYPDGWSTADVKRAANNRYGGKVTTVHPAPVGSSRSSSRRSSGGGGGSSSGGGGGCMPFIGLIALIIIGGVAGSGGDDDKTPTQTPEYAPVERVEAAPAPTAEPQFESYASPPPSYCITDNFEPC